MISASKVVEDGLDAPARPDDRTRWGWLAAGLLIGAALSVLVLRSDADLDPGITTSSTVSDEVALMTLGGIGDVVEGFPDGLTSTARADGRSLELMIWPVGGQAYARAIPVGSSTPPGPVLFDRSGTRIATLLPLPDHVFGILYAGVPEIASAIALDVTGFAWHDSQPHALAYSTFADGEMRLWVARDNLGAAELVAQAVGIDGHIAAWGDWGYAVQDDARDSIVLFTDTGEIKDMHPGRILDSYATGWIAVDQEGVVSLLSAGGGVRGLARPGLAGEIVSGRFARNGESLALLTEERILVVSLDDDTDLIESGGEAGMPQIAWSSDGQFVSYPGKRGIWVIEVDNGEVDQVLRDQAFTGLATLPLSESWQANSGPSRK